MSEDSKFFQNPAVSIPVKGVGLSMVWEESRPGLRVLYMHKKIEIIQNRYGIRMAGGDFCYDRISGALGYKGDPTLGQVYPFTDLDGPLKANISIGNTGILINGCQLDFPVS